MKYHVEKLRDDGTWQVYRNGQTFNSPDAARRLLNRLMDRYGEDRVRLVTEKIGECGKFQGFTIYQNDDGFYWANGGYHDDIAECQDEIARYNDEAEPHEDSPCLGVPWWNER